MKQITVAIFLSAISIGLSGCRTDTPKTATPQPQQQQPQTPQASQPTQKVTDCDAIPDPGQAEDCRFLKKVEAAKKRNKSDYVVKHSPGSIQQP